MSELINLIEVERSFRSWHGLYYELNTDSPAVGIVIDKMIETATTLIEYTRVSQVKLSALQEAIVIDRIDSFCKDNIKSWIEVASNARVGKFVIDRAVDAIGYTASYAFEHSLKSLNEIEFWPIQSIVAKAWILRANGMAKTTDTVLDLYFQQKRHCPDDGSSAWAANMISKLCPKENDLRFEELISVRNKIRDTLDPLRKRIISLILEMSLTEDQWRRV